MMMRMQKETILANGTPEDGLAEGYTGYVPQYGILAELCMASKEARLFC